MASKDVVIQHIIKGFIVLAICLSVPAMSLPYHISSAEIEVDRLNQHLNVSLKVMPEEFKQAMAIYLSSKRFILDDKAETDKAIVSYLREHFKVMDNKGVQLPLAWLGKSVKYNDIRLYFQIEIGEVSSFVIVNTLLLDVEPEQTNYVRVKNTNKTFTLMFSHESRQQSLELPE